MRNFATILAAVFAWGQGKHPVGYDDTPMLPGGEWHVHDGKRPQPPVVTPAGPLTTPPPPDAIVLFGGKDLERWRGPEGKPAGWKIADGAFEVVAGAGDVSTVETFGDCQLHLEWREPSPPKSESQGRGNSGVFFMDRYELQILDSFENPTYPDGQCAALYGQFPPRVNACLPPGTWQSYDVVFTAPRFEGGKLAAPATMSVLHNGICVHEHVALLGATAHRAVAAYAPHEPAGPLRLQDHGDPVRFRNVWIRRL